jgi:vitamin B12 transporter
MLALALQLFVSAADAGVTQLPPVFVQAPAEAETAPLPTSPTVRDSTATLSTRDATNARPEAKDAAELLNTTPGVSVQDSGGAGQRKTLTLRGASSNAVLVLLDGVPLQGPGASMDLSRIPIAALEKIEVLRGSASARYGPGAMGGVVNLVTLLPKSGGRFFGDVTAGSFSTVQLSAGASASVLGGEGLALVYGLRSDGTFNYLYDAQPATPDNALTTLKRVNNGTAQGGGLLRFRRRFGSTQLDVMSEGTYEERGLAGPVQNPSPSAWQRTGRGTLSVRAQHDFDFGGSLAALTWGRLDDTTLSGSFFGGLYHQLEASAGAEAVYTQLIGRHGLTGLINGGFDSLFSTSKYSWGRFGAMLADDVLFFDGAWVVSGSARIDVAGPFTVFSPKLGTSVELPLGFSIKGNIGLASRPPSFSEMYVVQGTLLPNSNLQPERAFTWDAGAKWTHSKASLSATGFYSLYSNLISYEYYPPNLARPYNFSAALAAGLEVEGEVHPFEWLQASASYTWTHTQNLRDDPRYFLKPLPFRPEHRLHARISGGPWFLQGHAEVLFQTQQFTNRTGTLFVPTRAMVNLGVTVTPWKNPRVSLSAELKNLLNVQTYDYDGYPLPPRAFFVTLGFSWSPTGGRR